MPITIPQLEIIKTAANQMIINEFEDTGFDTASQHLLSDGQVRMVLKAYLGLTEDQQDDIKKSFNTTKAALWKR